MTDLSPFNEKYKLMSSLVDQYPVIDLRRQYQNLRLKRWLSDNALAFLLQYICLMTSTLLPNYSFIWFASGAACGMTFLRGYRVMIGIGLGCFVTLYLNLHQVNVSIISASVLVLQTGLLTSGTRLFINPSLVFYHSKKLILFFLYSAVITALSSLALIKIFALPYLLWPHWWLANLNGILIAAIAWVTTDTFYTYGGKSDAWHLTWCKTIRFLFVSTFVLNLLFCFTLVKIMALSSVIAVQAFLCLLTVCGLLLSL